jgi:hypothetical protein
LAKCSQKTKLGKPCRMAVIRGTRLCAAHTPGMTSEAGKIGGHRRRIFDPTKLARFDPPQNAQELIALIARTICEVREAKIDAKAANTIACLSSAFLQSLNHGAVEDRLAQLEKQYKDREKL